VTVADDEVDKSYWGELESESSEEESEKEEEEEQDLESGLVTPGETSVASCCLIVISLQWFIHLSCHVYVQTGEVDELVLMVVIWDPWALWRLGADRQSARMSEN